MIISFEATDVFLFYIFFEAMLIPMYFLIGGFGDRAHEHGEKAAATQRSYAAVKFLLYNLVGGLIMLAAVIGLYVVAGNFSLTEIAEARANGSLDMATNTERWLFLGFFFAFAVKAPLWPLHTWLPNAMQESTAPVAVLITAVVDKVGTFAMLRFCLQLFPEASKWATPAILVLALISIIYGALLAVGQRDIKRLVAYASISHFGFIIMGIFAMTSQGQSGATLYMVNHGISTAALMLVAGFLISRRGSRLIADYGGVQKVAPVLAGTFLIGGLATLSLPGLAPFVSEFLVLVGTFTRYPVVGIIATFGIVLAALYTLVLYQRTMTGPVKPELARCRTSGCGTRGRRPAGRPADLPGRLPEAPHAGHRPGGQADHVRRTAEGPHSPRWRRPSERNSRPQPVDNGGRPDLEDRRAEDRIRAARAHPDHRRCGDRRGPGRGVRTAQVPLLRPDVRAVVALAAAFAAVVALAADGYGTTKAHIAAMGAIAVDGPALFLQGTILLAALVGLFTFAERRLDPEAHGNRVDSFAAQAASVPGSESEKAAVKAGFTTTEVFPLLLFAVAGMLVFPAANDLLTLFVALEVFSLPLYLLCALARRKRLMSQEAAVKYFLLGAFASAFTLFGIALLYGYAGSMSYATIAQVVDGTVRTSTRRSPAPWATTRCC